MIDTNMTDEIRMRLIKHAISSKEGWKNLAQAVINGNTKEQCIELLCKIAGDKEVEIPVIEECEEGQTLQDSMDAEVKTVKVKFAELLVQQLEQHITEIEAEGK